MLGLSSCFDKGGNIDNFPPTPAIVDFYSSFLQPKILTPHGTFFAPELTSAIGELNDGDAIIAQFSINYDQQSPGSDFYTVSDIQGNWIKIDKSYPGTTPVGDFDIPIEKMGIFWGTGNVLFFLFQQTAPTDQKFVYEMTFDPENQKVVYIRAKKEGTASKPSDTFTYPFVFDMSNYYWRLPGYDKDVEFKIMYYTGKDGEDGFKEYEDNPVKVLLKAE